MRNIVLQRWTMLCLYCSNALMNAAIWVTFSSITSESRLYYHKSSTYINMLSIVFMLTFLPGSVLSSWITTRYDFRVLMCVGTVCDVIGTWLRYASVLLHGVSPTLAFVVLMVGQLIASVAQPMFANSPATVAGIWFPAEGRDTATVIGSMFYPLGNAVIIVLGPIVVTSNPNTKTVHGMNYLLLGEAVLCSLVAVFTLLLFKSRPAVPPSVSASKREHLRRDASRQRVSISESNKTNGSPQVVEVSAQQQTPLLHLPNTDSGEDDFMANSALKVVLGEVRTLLSDFEFIKLMLGFSLGIGTFNALLTVLEQIGEPCGYTSNDAGMFGGIFLGAGLIGAAVTAPLLEWSKAYRPALKIGAIIGSGAVVFFVYSLQPNNKTMLALGWATMGAATTPLLPICFSNASEVSYPIPEETALSLLGTVGQYTGILSVFAFDYFIHMRPHYTNWYSSPPSIFLCSSLALAFMFAFAYNGEYKRLRSECE